VGSDVRKKRKTPLFASGEVVARRRHQTSESESGTPRAPQVVRSPSDLAATLALRERTAVRLPTLPTQLAGKVGSGLLISRVGRLCFEWHGRASAGAPWRVPEQAGGGRRIVGSFPPPFRPNSK